MYPRLKPIFLFGFYIISYGEIFIQGKNYEFYNSCELRVFGIEVRWTFFFFHPFSSFFSSSLCCGIVHTTLEHHKILSFSSSLQPQINAFLLPIKTVIPHNFCSYQIAFKKLIKLPFLLVLTKPQNPFFDNF